MEVAVRNNSSLVVLLSFNQATRRDAGIFLFAICAVVLIYVHDSAQDTTTYFNQSPAAHDFHGCLLWPAVSPEVIPSSMHPRPVVC